MKIETTRTSVQIFLDDRDLRDLLSGKNVVMPELGANDQRPLMISRWKNPELKIMSKESDVKAIEILTGENPYKRAQAQREALQDLPDAKPFEVQDNALSERFSEEEIFKTGAKVSDEIPR